jgi:gas vesicle protein
MSDKNKNGFVKGTIIGAAIGAIGGILFAPKSGKETRKDISDAAVKAKNSAEAKLKAAYSELGNLAAKAKKEAEELKGKAKTEYEKLANKLEAAQIRIKELITSVREGEIDEKDIDKALAEAHKLIDEVGDKIKKTK